MGGLNRIYFIVDNSGNLNEDTSIRAFISSLQKGISHFEMKQYSMFIGPKSLKALHKDKSEKRSYSDKMYLQNETAIRCTGVVL